MIDESVALPKALTLIEQAKHLIHELELLMPVSSMRNFRERLIHEIEQRDDDVEFQHQARVLLHFYSDHFGVKDLIDNLDAAADSG